MRTVSLSEFRKRSTALARAAAAGEIIAITDRGRPIARIIPHRPAMASWIPREDADAMFRRLHAADADRSHEAVRADKDPAISPHIGKLDQPDG